MQTDYKKFLDVLKNQDSVSIKRGDFEKVKVTKQTADDGDKIVLLNQDQVGFVFTSEGRFKYLYNWKG